MDESSSGSMIQSHPDAEAAADGGPDAPRGAELDGTGRSAPRRAGQALRRARRSLAAAGRALRRHARAARHTVVRAGDGLRRRGDAGMATAEYAIATVAAAGFAGLLIAILRSPEVKALLFGIVRGALSV